MATNGKDVAKNMRAIKRAIGIKGPVKPGEVTMKARAIMAQPPKKSSNAKKLPPLHTPKGVAARGLI